MDLGFGQRLRFALSIANLLLKPRWLLWLEARQRTRLAVQQQRFDVFKTC